jgi:hypothetical protein
MQGTTARVLGRLLDFDGDAGTGGEAGEGAKEEEKY